MPRVASAIVIMDKPFTTSVSNKMRLPIVDAVKGFAIILMVLGHTEQGAMHRQIWASSQRIEYAVKFADAFIYSFHMPAFFFVSGLFLASSVGRRGRLGFVLEKAKTLLYPYILWALLGILTDPLTLRFRSVTRLPSFHDRFLGLVTGDSNWFLITLFVTQLSALLLLRLPHWLQMLTALAACLLVPSGSIAVLSKPLLFFPFVVAGIWFSPERVRRVVTISKPVAWTGFLVLLIALLTVTGRWGYANFWDRIPIGLTGTAMLLLLSQGIGGTRCERVLCWFGQASLGIFILAAMFQGAAREFVVRVLHSTNPLVYLTLITACAATFPAILWFSQDRLHIGWLFQWPSRNKGSGSKLRAYEPGRATPSL